MKSLVFSTLTLLVLVTWSNKLIASPVVIYDSGQTQSLTRYQVIIKTPISVPRYTLKTPEIKYPVKTLELTPGKVTTRRIHNPYLDRPVFIIGNDKLSLAWLQQHAPQLQKLHATGMIVNVKTAQQLRQIRQLVPGLEINPISGSSLTKQLSLQNYPVLISQTRIEQ